LRPTGVKGIKPSHMLVLFVSCSWYNIRSRTGGRIGTQPPPPNPTGGAAASPPSLCILRSHRARCPACSSIRFRPSFTVFWARGGGGSGENGGVHKTADLGMRPANNAVRWGGDSVQPDSVPPDNRNRLGRGGPVSSTASEEMLNLYFLGDEYRWVWCDLGFRGRRGKKTTTEETSPDQNH